MKKRLLSAALALSLCLGSAAAADLGTLTLSSDREAADDAPLRMMAQATEPTELVLRTPSGETGFLRFDGKSYHWQPCGQPEERPRSVLFSADGDNAYGLPYTGWFLADIDIGQHIFDPLTEWDAGRICSVARWTDCGTQYLTGQGKLKPPAVPLTRFWELHRTRAAALTLQGTLGDPVYLAYHDGVYTLTETGTERFVQTQWTQLVPLPTDSTRTLSLTLRSDTGEKRELLTYAVTPPYLDTDCTKE